MKFNANIVSVVQISSRRIISSGKTLIMWNVRISSRVSVIEIFRTRICYENISNDIKTLLKYAIMPKLNWVWNMQIKKKQKINRFQIPKCNSQCRPNQVNGYVHVTELDKNPNLFIYALILCQYIFYRQFCRLELHTCTNARESSINRFITFQVLLTSVDLWPIVLTMNFHCSRQINVVKFEKYLTCAFL